MDSLQFKGEKSEGYKNTKRVLEQVLEKGHNLLEGGQS